METNVIVPIESARLNIDRLGIKFHDLPTRPIWGPIFGIPESEYKARIARKVMAGSIATGRQLTPDETDALSEHYAALMNTQDYGAPVYLLVSTAIWWRTQEKFSFPFWTPKKNGNFNPNKMFGIERPYMPRLWNSLRWGAWYAGSKFVVGIFFASSAISAYTQKYVADTRLSDYRKDLRKDQVQAAQKALNQAQGGRQSQPALPAKEESFESWPSAEQTEDAQTPLPAVQRSQPESTSDAFAVDEPYVFDDASPVAPAQQQRSTPRRPAQTGSAWDRIRKGNQAQAGDDATGQGSTQQTSAWGRKRDDELTSRGAQDGSSYTYSSRDEQKSYAREQSQKEFDEMLERERRGEASGRR